MNFGFQSGYRLIGNRRLNPSIRTKMSDFIFGLIVASSSCSASFFIDVTGVGDVFNIKRPPYAFKFCHVYAGISSVDNWAFNKKLSHLVLIGCDFYSLVLSDNLNGCGANWMHLLQA
jgi:hypothetical protein